jgi:hypothetical protein
LPQFIAAAASQRLTKKAVETVLRAPHFKHVELWLAKLDESEYTLKFEASVV